MISPSTQSNYMGYNPYSGNHHETNIKTNGACYYGVEYENNISGFLPPIEANRSAYQMTENNDGPETSMVHPESNKSKKTLFKKGF